MANSELPSARALSLDSAQRALTPWLAARLKVPDLNVVAWRSAGSGNSADTFFATVAGIFEGAAREIPLVIRRQNLGSDIFLDSDLSLPTRVMAAVGAHPAGAGIPVPKVIGLESDADLIGAPFMVMEQLPGRILPQSPNYNKEGWLADMSADHHTASVKFNLRFPVLTRRVCVCRPAHPSRIQYRNLIHRLASQASDHCG